MSETGYTVVTVGITEFRRCLSRILREVEAGAIYRITRRGKPIVYVVPPSFLLEPYPHETNP